MQDSEFYAKRGVSSSKKEIHAAIQNLDPGLNPGAFCKILPDTLSGSDDHCLVMHADGAGTKSALAYVYWRETGDLSVFKNIAMDSLVMNMDDMACVGAVDRFLLSNTIGRNSFFIPGEVIQAVIEGLNDAVKMLANYDIQIDFCGGETADVGDVVRTLMVDVTMTARIHRERILDLDNIEDGDQIIGLTSFGQAVWEKEYNSGIGSNGLTAARHDCFDKSYAKKYPESFSPEIPESSVYCGSGKMEDLLPHTGLSLGRAILSPTRTYLPVIKEVLNRFPTQISGMIHCTGGGQTKCMKFGKQIHYVKDNLFPIPPIFNYIQKTNNYSWKEMAMVYNLGHRLEIFTKKDQVSDIIQIANDFGIEGQVIGHCRKRDVEGNKLSIRLNGDTFEYE